MATHRPAIPEITKRALRNEAGGKCANPGCPAARTHVHHIREWAVYQTHDERHMVAVCPTCHDAIHHGDVDISDERVYRWKGIVREGGGARGHLYVEPGPAAKLLLGSVAVTGDAGLLVFELAKGNTLSFSLVDQEIVLLSLVLTDRRGAEVARLADGYVTVADEDGLSYRQAPGRHTITAPMNRRFMPNWALRQIQGSEPSYQSGDVESLTLLDLEVLEPGLVRVSGVWLELYHGIVITPTRLHFVRVDPRKQRSIAFAGGGAQSVIHHAGPITGALFGFGEGRGTLNLAPERSRSIFERHR